MGRGLDSLRLINGFGPAPTIDLTLMMNFLRKQHRPDDLQSIIRTEMVFLLEKDERSFERQLRARLLNEGCNFPMKLAKPRFYEQMLSELQELVPAASRPKFQALATGSARHAATPAHPEFHAAIRFCASTAHDSARRMALAVTKTIGKIVEEWQLPPEMFLEDSEPFAERVSALTSPLWDASPISFENIRQRLYPALVTALLSKMTVRHEFEREFGSIPDLLHAMQSDHGAFCRFMNFCRERSPYFQQIVSRTFWRVLEMLSLEERR